MVTYQQKSFQQLSIQISSETCFTNLCFHRKKLKKMQRKTQFVQRCCCRLLPPGRRHSGSDNIFACMAEHVGRMCWCRRDQTRLASYNLWLTQSPNPSPRLPSIRLDQPRFVMTASCPSTVRVKEHFKVKYVLLNNLQDFLAVRLVWTPEGQCVFYHSLSSCVKEFLWFKMFQR